MPKTEAFEAHPEDYDDWFERYPQVYASELAAVAQAVPRDELGEAVEVGAGSGRFAVPLGITLGVEPSPKMAERARERGMEIVEGTAEVLPFREGRFNTVLFVTTICFVDDVKLALREAYRVLKGGGHLVIGFVDAQSPLGKLYQEKRQQSKFYGDAQFYTAEQVVGWLLKTGFEPPQMWQTIFKPLDEITAPEPVREGTGAGSFVVLKARKPPSL
ncbi:MAG: SAM-dependent methyltransferase [Planctomycetales bacterium 4484_113]|nr:MAG: SAM-dependent methyltransferase [Planctomycetales bacterium 4484_113]